MSGISQIKRRIYSKRVLIVLDDVDDNEQLNALAGSQSWFCPGSRIVITTRNEHILNIDNEFQEFRVHEQIQDMGRHIVSQKKPPELRSRLWNNDEILHLLKHKKGTENIKGIALQSEKGKRTCVGAETFETMTKLMLLHINHTEIEGCHALKELPSSIYQLGSLKNLILEGCPNFSTFPEQPAGARFPGSFLARENSEVLVDGDKFPVKESEALEVVPTCQGQMRDLTVLNISGTSITKIPQSFREYSKLTYLILDYNSQITMIPPSFSHLRYLKRLRARQCKWSEDANPSSFGVLPSVKTLDLCYSDFNTLPSCISSSFPNVEELSLEECKNLHSLPSLPSSLVQLDLIDCTGLETIFDVSNLTGLKSLSLTGCEQLVEVHRLESLKTLRTLNMPPCRNTGSALERAVFEDEAFVRLNHLEISANVIARGLTGKQLSFLFPKGPTMEHLENMDFDIFVKEENPKELGIFLFEVIGDDQEIVCRTLEKAQYEGDGICAVLFDRDDEIPKWLRNGYRRVHVTALRPEFMTDGVVSVGPWENEPSIFLGDKSSRVMKYFSRPLP
ncbi:Internalin-I [Nymphaea thermarum]|nr:Internalin-I [Nymphaea thermarum]